MKGLHWLTAAKITNGRSQQPVLSLHQWPLVIQLIRALMLIVTFGDCNNSTLINSFNRDALKINISESKGKPGVRFNQTIALCPWDISFTAQMALCFVIAQRDLPTLIVEKHKAIPFEIVLFSFSQKPLLHCRVRISLCNDLHTDVPVKRWSLC